MNSRRLIMRSTSSATQRAEFDKGALHFVGFKEERYQRAVRVFGQPDFIHRRWDRRAVAEVFEGDVVIFAERDETQPIFPWTYDDSAYF